MRTDCPWDVARCARAASQARVWVDWAGDCSSSLCGPKPTATFLDPIITLLSQKPKPSWGAANQAALRNFVSGGLWTKDRLFRVGIVDSGLCVCGAIQTNGHCVFGCDRFAGHRKAWEDPDMFFALQRHFGTWAVERLLVQDPLGVPSDLPVAEFVVATGVCTDPNFSVSG